MSYLFQDILNSPTPVGYWYNALHFVGSNFVHYIKSCIVLGGHGGLINIIWVDTYHTLIQDMLLNASTQVLTSKTKCTVFSKNWILSKTDQP